MLLAALVAGARGASGAAAKASRPNKFVVLFIDFSQSTTSDRGSYQSFATDILNAMGPGDRFAVAEIGDRTLTDFHPIAGADLRPYKEPKERSRFAEWDLSPLQRKHEAEVLAAENKGVDADAKGRIQDEELKLTQFFTRNEQTQKTSVLTALNVANQLFADDPRSKILIILSDMLEDSEKYSFDSMHLTEEEDVKILNAQRNSGELPNLNNVRFCVGGARAASQDKYREVRDFWLLYVKATGADVSADRYSHWLINCIGAEGSPRPTVAEAGLASNPELCRVNFQVGVDKISVLAVEGNPTRRDPRPDGEVWYYDSSFVRFSPSNRVTNFFNAGNLRSCR